MIVRFLPFLLSFVSVSFVLVFSFVPAPAQAQYGGVGGGTGGGAFSGKYYSKSPEHIAMALQRRPELPTGQFVLHLSTEQAMNGCPKLSNMGYETEFQDIFLNIKVLDYTVDMRKLTRHPQYDCDQRQVYPSADIILNRDALIMNDTKHIRLRNGSFTETYDIEMDDRHIRLVPGESNKPGFQRYRAQKLATVKNPLNFWFYPKGTLILSVPDAKRGQKTTAAVALFAKSSGLLPLASLYPDFQSPLDLSHHYYYVDQGGRFTDTAGQDKIIGTIRVEKQIYGLHDTETVLEEMSVHAKLPGMYD